MSNRFQTVGSLLRPEALLAYKRKIEDREDIRYPFYDDFPGYQQAEAEATKAVVAKQAEHGLTVLTDGEYSKSMWHLDFIWGLGGAERRFADHGYFFRDKDEHGHFETRRDIGIAITGPLSGKNHHFIEIYKQLAAVAPEGAALKQCVWAAAHAYTELAIFDKLAGPGQVYADNEALKQGVIQAYKEFVAEYAAAGGKIIQFDDCLWELFASDNDNSPFTGGTNSPEVLGLAEDFVNINNQIIDYAHSLGLTVWTHNCRGNYASRNMGGGSYSAIAKLFLGQQRYDRFFLEWDDDRAGSLEALAAFKDRPDTEIVLGLLSSKNNQLDDEARVLRLLDEASSMIPKERLYLSHQCGFASCDGGNELSEAEQWAKIDQGQRLAQSYWGE
ncbi:cobalamin-independent methionine synthase II family protein [Oscillibacter sp. GMB15532]|uniref:cobalamin-independent methionine synthase II family protein n=1 Tax=Oscillibacter sp. GMB15532 TaxID=3230022 RepID=UPI0034DF3A80